MKISKKIILIVPILLLVLFKFGGQLVADNEEYGISSAKKIETKIKRVTMDDEQWKKKLTPEQYDSKESWNRKTFW